MKSLSDFANPRKIAQRFERFKRFGGPGKSLQSLVNATKSLDMSSDWGPELTESDPNGSESLRTNGSHRCALDTLTCMSRWTWGTGSDSTSRHGDRTGTVIQCKMCVCACVHVCMCACMHAYVRTCVRVYVCTYIYEHVYTARGEPVAGAATRPLWDAVSAVSVTDPGRRTASY